MRQEQAITKPGPKEFGFGTPEVDREGHRVGIPYAGKIYQWFLRDDARTCILVNEDKRILSEAVVEAMESQVLAILGPVVREWRIQKGIDN